MFGKVIGMAACHLPGERFDMVLYEVRASGQVWKHISKICLQLGQVGELPRQEVISPGDQSERIVFECRFRSENILILNDRC